jgi:uncharacterized protein DUF5666
MTTLAIHPFGLALLAAVAVGVAGCGNGAGSSVAPTAATLSSSSSVQDSHGGGNSGPGNNSGSGNNNAPGNNSGPGKGDDGHNGVEVHGSIQSISGACPAKQLTIAGRNVSTSMSTEFRDTTCANLAVGQMAEVKGMLQSDGTIAADRVEVAGKDDDDHGEGEVSGPVTASTGICPALTLTVGTSIVKTTAATIFHDVACSDVHVGTRIEANGTRQSDGSLLASRLEREEDE